jgi:hypothetical protein
VNAVPFATQCLGCFVPLLPLTRAACLEPGDARDHRRAELPISRRQVDFAVHRDDLSTEIDELVEVLRTADEPVQIHRDDDLKVMTDPAQHRVPFGALSTDGRCADFVVLVRRDDWPFLRPRQRNATLALGLDPLGAFEGLTQIERSAPVHGTAHSRPYT